MADNAEIRIVLKDEDQGKPAPSAPPPPVSPPPAQAAPQPPSQPKAGITPQEYSLLVKDFGEKQAAIVAAAQGGVVQPAQTTAAGVQQPATFSGAATPQAQAAAPAFDPNAEAQKRLEREQRQGEVQAAYDKLKPPEAEKPTPAFDPNKDAADQREAEIKREQVKAAYEGMYKDAKETKSAFDQTLDFAQQIRGTMGWVLGTFVGTGLDILAAYRKAQPAEKSGIRQEAESRNAALQQATQAAGPQTAPTGPTTQAATAASGEAATAAGTGLAVLAIGVVASVKAFQSLTSAIDSQVQKFAQYNPEIATAQAMAEVRATFGDIRRAQESAPALTQYIQAQSNFEQSFEELKTQLLTNLAPLATAIFDILGTIFHALQVGLSPLELVGDFIEWLSKAIKSILRLLGLIAAENANDQDFSFFDPRSMVFPNVAGV